MVIRCNQFSYIYVIEWRTVFVSYYYKICSGRFPVCLHKDILYGYADTVFAFRHDISEIKKKKFPLLMNATREYKFVKNILRVACML